MIRIAAALSLVLSATALASPPIAIDSRLEPFLDTYLIGSQANTTLRLQVPRPAETVIQFNDKWEGRYCGYVTVFKDGDRYRMYYRGNPLAGKDGSDWEVTCYAESPDGICFRWHPDPVLDVTPDGWDSRGTCYPSIVHLPGRTLMYYVGNGVNPSEQLDGIGVAELEA